MSLHDVVVLDLITCGEVGLVIRLHLLEGEVRTVTTALKVVEEDCRRLKENEKKKLDGMENSKSKSDAHCMHGWHESRAQLELVPRCAVQIMTTRT